MVTMETDGQTDGLSQEDIEFFNYLVPLITPIFESYSNQTVAKRFGIAHLKHLTDVLDQGPPHKVWKNVPKGPQLREEQANVPMTDIDFSPNPGCHCCAWSYPGFVCIKVCC